MINNKDAPPRGLRSPLSPCRQKTPKKGTRYAAPSCVGLLVHHQTTADREISTRIQKATLCTSSSSSWTRLRLAPRGIGLDLPRGVSETPDTSTENRTSTRVPPLALTTPVLLYSTRALIPGPENKFPDPASKEHMAGSTPSQKAKDGASGAPERRPRSKKPSLPHPISLSPSRRPGT